MINLSGEGILENGGWGVGGVSWFSFNFLSLQLEYSEIYSLLAKVLKHLIFSRSILEAGRRSIWKVNEIGIKLIKHVFRTFLGQRQ